MSPHVGRSSGTVGAGSVGPTGELMQRAVELPPGNYNDFDKQIGGLKEFEAQLAVHFESLSKGWSPK